METTEKSGGTLSVDVNENEEEGVKALLAAVSQEAGRAHGYGTGTGRNVNRDAAAPPPPHIHHIMLDLLAAETRLPDHSGLNGFTEEERTVFMVGGGGGEEGGGGGGGTGLGGFTAASCPAVLGARVSAEPQTQRERQQEALDARACGGRVRTSLRGDRTPCARTQQRSCACTAAASPFPDGDMRNGDVGGPVRPDVDVASCAQTDVFSCQSAAGRGVGRGEVKVANGGFHIVTAATAARDSDCFPENSSDLHADSQAGREDGSGSSFSSTSQRDVTGGGGSDRPGDDAPELPPSSVPTPSKDSPKPGSSAKLPSPGRPAPPDLTAEDEEDEEEGEGGEERCGGLSLPVRPQSLRTVSHITVSLSCDATPLSPDQDGGFCFGDEGYEEDFRNAGRRQSAPDKLPDLDSEPRPSEPRPMPKRFGIADFFTRSLFSRRSRELKASHHATGWRLFAKTASEKEGQVPQDPSPPSPSAQQEEQVKGSAVSSCPQRPLAAGRRKNLEFEPLSTTALILEDRPANLPAKSLEETQRHKLEYEEMVAGAKRRELKDAQKKKRQMKERHRQEDSISHAMVVWNNDILPYWDAMKGTRRVRELWWQGLPPSIRGRVWSLAIGNELNITPELYEIFLSRAKEKWRSYSETSSVNDNESDGGASLADRESSLDLIKLDISRTFPSLFIFQKGGPYHDLLHSVLGAYTCYRPDIGYVQGMSFIAAVLILNLEEADAFITFANLLNKPCQMAFFRVDHELMLKYFSAFEVFFEENLPRLFSHFQINSLTPDLYLIDWIFTLFSKSLPLDVACRVWDVFCRDGEESLFRTGLGILRLYEDVLLQMDFIHIAQFLSRLPDDLQSHTLFGAMANTHMISKNRRWAQVFSALMKDGNKESDRNSSPALRS